MSVYFPQDLGSIRSNVSVPELVTAIRTNMVIWEAGTHFAAINYTEPKTYRFHYEGLTFDMTEEMDFLLRRRLVTAIYTTSSQEPFVSPPHVILTAGGGDW